MSHTNMSATPNNKPKKSVKRRSKQVTKMHPPVSEMVTQAIETLSSRKGCSVRAIKKFIASNFTVDMNRLSPFIKRCLAKGVENDIFIQMTGHGCVGSFKLATKNKKKTGSNTKVQVKKKPNKNAKKTKRNSSSDTKQALSKKMSSSFEGNRKSIEKAVIKPEN